MSALDLTQTVATPTLAEALGAPETVRPASKDPQALRQACQQFEAVLLSQLLQKMRDTVPEDPLLGDNNEQKIYYSMLDWEMAQQVSRTQGVGIADMLYRQLSRLIQPAASAPGASAAETAPTATDAAATAKAGGS